jgi:hypothetical protein
MKIFALTAIAALSAVEAAEQASIHLRVHDKGGSCTITNESQCNGQHVLRRLELRVPLVGRRPERAALPEEENDRYDGNDGHHGHHWHDGNGWHRGRLGCLHGRQEVQDPL